MSATRRAGATGGCRVALKYEGNPKHKEPWQAGRKGALCPKWSHQQVAILLRDSIDDGQQRYATMNGVAFSAQQHLPDVWHGYPVPWVEVPHKIWRKWLETGLVSRRQLRAGWEEVDASADE